MSLGSLVVCPPVPGGYLVVPGGYLVVLMENKYVPSRGVKEFITSTHESWATTPSCPSPSNTSTHTCLTTRWLERAEEGAGQEEDRHQTK